MRNFTTVGDVRVYILDFLHPGTQYQLKVAAETIEIGPSSEYELFTTNDDGISIAYNIKQFLYDLKIYAWL